MRIGRRYLASALAAGAATVAIAAAPTAMAEPAPAQPGMVATTPAVVNTDWHGGHWGHGHGDWGGDWHGGGWGPWLPWGWHR
jgi:Spy/CpxP family protein refolding chaperone